MKKRILLILSMFSTVLFSAQSFDPKLKDRDSLYIVYPLTENKNTKIINYFTKEMVKTPFEFTEKKYYTLLGVEAEELTENNYYIEKVDGVACRVVRYIK